MKLLGDRVAIKRDEAEDKSAGGIVLPDHAKERPASGVIVALGPGAIHPKANERIPPSVKIGEKVLFSSYAGGKVEVEGQEVWILAESDILAVVE